MNDGGNSALLSLRDVHVRFNTAAGVVRAVRGVSVDLAVGETLGLVGESGCGKSTLGKAIMKLVPIAGGEIRIEGVDIAPLDRQKLIEMRRKVQMIFQDPYGSLNPRSTVGRSVAQPLVLAGWKPEAITERVETLPALQDLVVTLAVADGASAPPRLVRQIVAAWVEALALASVGDCGYGDVGAVVGATYPRELQELRREMPHAWLLVPGYGVQGGGADDVAAAFDPQGLGAIVNNSRGILFAFAAKEYASQVTEASWSEAVRWATEAMIEALRERTTVGTL